ncbi:MAG: trigger factor [Armatimonadota bacterium]|nr:trigger factor [Armatimonadota bacterium]MDR7436584.1 trigger factor [Armatimonadota bacterium]MDR7473104.1 trigger factor [Armatimonadota bacterium]MDR7506595.1 trigger factor [Armatimonadota bacterium]MDR7509169.1 trigger factor [Armatimonadota bacterium]
MKVEVRREAPARAVLEVEIPPEVVSRGVERALQRVNQRVEIPGFRRGRAPRSLLVRHVGWEAISDEAVKLLVPDAYAEAVRQSGLRPLAQPEIQVDEVAEGRPLRFVATVDLVPEVDPGDYRGIRIDPADPRVTEADVDTAVEDLRARHARLESVPGPAEGGDYVLIRTEEVSGAAERWLPGKEYLVEIGSGVYPAALESALTGVRAGDRRSVTLEGGAQVTVQVVDVRRRRLPEPTDDFARLAAGVETMEQLRARLRERLEAEARERARREDEQRTLDALLARARVELPARLVDHEVDHLVEDLTESLARRGLTLERYLQVQEMTEARLREDLRPVAEKRLRTRLVLDEVARAEGLDPAQEEIDHEVENVARDLRQDPLQVRQWLERSGRLEGMRAALRRQKALAFLVAVARGETT